MGIGNNQFDSKWMKEFYNKKVGKRIKTDYEYYRWFSNSRKRRQYDSSLKSLLFHLQDINFSNCLEIGCGPGTWTKVLLEKFPNANFFCIDISKEMLSQFKRTIKNKKVITIENNFLDENFQNQKFDFVFSSRAIEYIPNKIEVIKKIYNLLEKNGKGLIITSPPHPLVLSIKKSLGKKIDIEHTQRISVKSMKKLLKETGFKKIQFYPILFSDFFLVPTRLLFNLYYKKHWNIISKIFASGYLVKFEK